MKDNQAPGFPSPVFQYVDRKQNDTRTGYPCYARFRAQAGYPRSPTTNQALGQDVQVRAMHHPRAGLFSERLPAIISVYPINVRNGGRELASRLPAEWPGPT